MKRYIVIILSLCGISLSAMDLDLERVKCLSLQEQEDMHLAQAVALSLEDKNKRTNSDYELARQLQQQEEEQLKKEQEERDRLLALSLQQEGDKTVQNKPKVKSIEDQLKEYRKRQLQNNLPRKSDDNRLQALANTLPLTHKTQAQKYAPFNRNLGSQLHLPGVTGKLKLPGIYHVFSCAVIPIQKKWSCTFHVLFNAFKIEKMLLGKKINSNFEQSCTMASNPQISANGLEVYTIAEKLHLSTLNYLGIEKNNYFTIPRSGILYYTCNIFDTSKQIKQKQLNARLQLTNQMWHNCLNILQKSGMQCVHFVGSIISHNIPHAVLYSVVKLHDGSKALYIFDNMNEDEDMRAQGQIRMLAEHIHNKLMQQ